MKYFLVVHILLIISSHLRQKGDIYYRCKIRNG